ncbi:glutamate racemase [uncultured Odoribacter sp.]|uniref:glutamate racemase n=1 Tax=uncultured Odoribacter sp. TaxID=876416 RepID=UPI00262130B2|nr:glutamate racemase [uncultured Odoribacter sp.]
MDKIKGPIGVFDSGYGGLTVLKEIMSVLPQYDYVYLGDNARTPYGTRSFDVVYRYTDQAVRKLFELGCPLVVLACNTASAKALRTIQQVDLPRLDSSLRVLGVIRPSVEALANYTRNGHIGIMATKGTVASESYLLEIEKLYGPGCFHITQVACPMWVPLVENNELTGAGTEYFVKKYADELFAADPRIDTVILGCTHYPLLRTLIARYMPADVKLIEQGHIVADRLRDYLVRHPEMEKRIGKKGNVSYLTTEKTGLFDRMAGMFIGKNLSAEQIEL